MPVYKDEKRGTYYFTVRVDTMDGTKQVKRRGFRTQREARVAESEVIADAARGMFEEDNATFGYVSKRYLEWYKRRRKASSYKKIESIVRVNILPIFEKKRLSDIRNRDITRFQDDLIDKKYSVHHIKKVHQTLSTIFNFAIREEYTLRNPAKEVGNIDDEETKHVNYWTLEEFKEFISVVDDYLYKTLFMTLYYSGMRKGELSALTWKDINFDNNTISIDKTAYDTEITTPKTSSSIRTLELPKYVMGMLQQLKITKEPEQKLSYFVFGDYHDHLPATTLDRKYDDYVKKTQLKKIRIHDFRHSHASYLINKGAIPAVVAKRLGHKDIAMTLNTYSHLYPSTENEIISQMEDDFKIAEVVQFKSV